jgi:chromosome segregation ATPase
MLKIATRQQGKAMSLTTKLIGGAIGLAVLLAAFLWFRSVLNERAELREWRDDVVTATRAAAANPKLDEKQVALQIQLLGTAIKACEGKLDSQNKAVSAVEASRKDAAKALEKAAGRVEGIGKTIDRLNASARSSKPVAGCEPSETLRSAWK